MRWSELALLGCSLLSLHFLCGILTTHPVYQNVEVQLAPQLKIRISSLADHTVTHFQMHLSADSN